MLEQGGLAGKGGSQARKSELLIQTFERPYPELVEG
jgi:hypothetical protein